MRKLISALILMMTTCAVATAAPNFNTEKFTIGAIHNDTGVVHPFPFTTIYEWQNGAYVPVPGNIYLGPIDPGRPGVFINNDLTAAEGGGGGTLSTGDETVAAIKNMFLAYAPTFIGCNTAANAAGTAAVGTEGPIVTDSMTKLVALDVGFNDSSDINWIDTGACGDYVPTAGFVPADLTDQVPYTPLVYSAIKTPAGFTDHSLIEFDTGYYVINPVNDGDVSDETFIPGNGVSVLFNPGDTYALAHAVPGWDTSNTINVTLGGSQESWDVVAKVTDVTPTLLTESKTDVAETYTEVSSRLLLTDFNRNINLDSTCDANLGVAGICEISVSDDAAGAVNNTGWSSTLLGVAPNRYIAARHSTADAGDTQVVQTIQATNDYNATDVTAFTFSTTTNFITDTDPIVTGLDNIVDTVPEGGHLLYANCDGSFTISDVTVDILYTNDNPTKVALKTGYTSSTVIEPGTTIGAGSYAICMYNEPASDTVVSANLGFGDWAGSWSATTEAASVDRVPDAGYVVANQTSVPYALTHSITTFINPTGMNANPIVTGISEGLEALSSISTIRNVGSDIQPPIGVRLDPTFAPNPGTTYPAFIELSGVRYDFNITTTSPATPLTNWTDTISGGSISPTAANASYSCTNGNTICSYVGSGGRSGSYLDWYNDYDVIGSINANLIGQNQYLQAGGKLGVWIYHTNTLSLPSNLRFSTPEGTFTTNCSGNISANVWTKCTATTALTQDANYFSIFMTTDNSMWDYQSAKIDDIEYVTP